MQLLCPSCGNFISPADINIDRALAICRECKSVTTLDQFGSQVIGARSPPSPMRRKRQEIRRPSHVSVKNDGISLRISFRWIWHSFTGPALMCFIWNCVIGFYYWLNLRTGAGDRLMWLGFIWGTPHVLIGLLLVYVTLAGLLNRTVIKLTSEFLSVRHGPVPWCGNRKLPLNDLERLYCRKDTAPEKQGWSYVYGIHALTKGGSNVDLMTDLDRALAQFIKQQLDRWLTN